MPACPAVPNAVSRRLSGRATLEVLSGPQGTLYGKNTIAGAIKYVTRDIAGPATLTVSATGGNFGEHDFKLSGSTPLIADHVYFGIALADMQHGGYGEVVAQPGQTPSPYNSIGESVSNKDILAGRANLTILWGGSSKLKLVADDTLRQFECLRRPTAQQLPRAAAQQPVRYVR